MNRTLKEIISTLIYFLIVLFATWMIITFVGQRTEVDGSSMEPNLYDNDQLIVEKLSYRFGDPHRFDVIVFPPRNEKEGVLYIKRIIGLPGETVQIDTKGSIYINGELLNESYGAEVIDENHIGRAVNPVTLGDDEYFVMGDNRNHSLDSRFDIVGNIKRDEIVGKAWVRIWPFERFGTIEHQMD